MNDTIKAFTRLVVEKFGDEYLNRCPTDAEKRRDVAMMARRHFPGAFAGWDCNHFVWKNCPVVLQGQYKGHAEGGKKTKIMEAIADQDTYLWYVFFGEPGSLNDLNVLSKSSIVSAILSGDLTSRYNNIQ
jgi:Plant transposon protein